MLTPSFLCTCSQAEHGTWRSACLRVSTAQQHTKHHCAINSILILHPKHGTVPSTKKKNNYPRQNQDKSVFDESIKLPLGSEIYHRTVIGSKSFSHLFLICHYTFLRALGCNALQPCPENILARKWIFNFCNVLQERMKVPQLIQILSRMFWNSLSSSTGVKMEHIIKMYWRKMPLSDFWNGCLLWKVQWVPISPFHKT